jgi:hypothetical protein
MHGPAGVRRPSRLAEDGEHLQRQRQSRCAGVTGIVHAMPRYTFSSFCKQRFTLTSAGISVSGKLVFQSVTPTSPT